MLRRTFLLLALAAVVSGAAVGVSAAVTRNATPAAATVSGRQLYRQFCGKCHALAVALSAGFGSSGGFGDLGGPSFNELRVPYAYSIQAITEPTGGHEIVRRHITSKQLSEVAIYIAKVTKSHPLPALPTDG